MFFNLENYKHLKVLIQGVGRGLIIQGAGRGLIIQGAGRGSDNEFTKRQMSTIVVNGQLRNLEQS